MPALHVLRVFCSPDGSGGNPLGVFLDGGEVPGDRRQAVATELGFSETVFLDDARAGSVAIFTPAAEVAFAGHPLVGTSWLLAREREAVDVLRPPAGEVPTWREGELTWIRGRPEWAPPMELVRLESPAEVDALEGAPGGGGFVDTWAFADEAAGVVRARVFVPALGIPEDEATGAAAVRLGAQIGRPIEIRQGRGSVIHARPAGEATEVRGRVMLDERRDHPMV